MSFTLEVTLLRKERAFERVVGLVGRRGYELVGATAELVDGGGRMAVRLELESERSADVLVRQLGKLRDVTDVRCASWRSTGRREYPER